MLRHRGDRTGERGTMRIFVAATLAGLAFLAGWPNAILAEFKRNHVLSTAAPTKPAGEAAAAPTTPAPPAETVLVTRYSRTNAFPIQFTFDPQIARSYDVFLYVSIDQGKTWRWYDRKNAAAQKFDFQAARDGEYDFAVLTVPAGTQPAQGVTLQSQLRYVIDTAAPQLGLEVTAGEDGAVRIAWQASDVYINAATVKLEFQAAGNAEWQPIAMERPRKLATQTALHGEVDLPLELDTPLTSGQMRLSARDLAENAAQVVKPLPLPPQPTQEATADKTAADWNAVPDDPQQIVDEAFAGMDTADDGQVAAADAGAAEATAAATPAPAVPAETSVAENTSVSPTAPKSIEWPSDDTTQNALAARTTRPAAPSVVSPPSTDHQPPTTASTEFASSRSTRDERDAPGGIGPVPLEDAPAGMAEGELPRMTRAMRFHLEYSIDAIGPSGVEKVELWITRDQGRNWQRLSIDEDRESPLLVEVEREGLYGFRVVIVAKNGLASPAPRSGDPAELWVAVDRTEPRAEITAAAYGTGVRSGQLDIRWNAIDEFLGPRPVTLLISEQKEGPWATIAAGLPNTGQYFWRADARVPDKFYLRLEVRDGAGNRTAVQTREPIASAGLIPKGRIQGISPLGD